MVNLISGWGIPSLFFFFSFFLFAAFVSFLPPLLSERFGDACFFLFPLRYSGAEDGLICSSFFSFVPRPIPACFAFEGPGFPLFFFRSFMAFFRPDREQGAPAVLLFSRTLEELVLEISPFFGPRHLSFRKRLVFFVSRRAWAVLFFPPLPLISFSGAVMMRFLFVDDGFGL